MRKTKISFSIFFLSLLLFPVVMKNNVFSSIEKSDTQLSQNESSYFLTIDDFSWTFGAFPFIGGDPILDSPVSNETFEYSITSNEIFVQENDTYQTAVGAYTTVPIVNNHLVYSCYLRAKANHPNARKMFVYYLNTTSLTLISGLPTLRYTEDGITTDTGYNYAQMDIPLEGFSEVIMFFCYHDSWTARNNQSFWVKDLKVYQIEAAPQDSTLESLNPLNSLNWTVDSFLNEPSEQEDLIPVSGNEGKYICSINETHLLLAENDTGVDYARIGAYITLPVEDNHVVFSFKAGGTATTHANIRHLLYNPNTMKQIPKQLTTQFQNTPGENILDYQIEVDIKIDDLDNVILLFYFVDSISLSQNHTYWITDLKISHSTTTPTIFTIDNPMNYLLVMSSLCALVVLFRNKRRT